MDAQLPPLLVGWLRERGHEAEHVTERGGLGASDDDIWREALRESCVVVSKDSDFAHRARQATVSVQIVWLRFGNCGNARLQLWLGNQWARIEKELARGESLVESHTPHS